MRWGNSDEEIDGEATCNAEVEENLERCKDKEIIAVNHREPRGGGL